MDAPLRLYHVDVFAERPFAGNPLAVVLGGESLDAEAMQTIARELKLSETAFVLPSERAAYRVRIFTPAIELPFAGHPTVGTAWLLAELGRIPSGAASPFEVEAGLLAAEPSADGPTWVRAPSPRPLASSPQGLPPSLQPARLAAELLPALGLRREDLLGPEPEVWETGNHHAVLLLAPGTDLAAVRPDSSRIAALLGVATCYVAVIEQPGRARVRVFVPGAGVPEDPATGSGAAALVGALAARHPAGLVDGAVEIVQGVEMRQPSVLHARQVPARGAAAPDEAETWIGGTCHLLYETGLPAPHPATTASG